MLATDSSYGPLAVLRRVRRPRPAPRPGEQCDMCATPIPEEHRHVVALDTRSLMCTCPPCTLLFENQGAGGGRHRAVPRDAYTLGDLELSPRQWDALQIPVGIAFMFHNSDTDAVSAFYPSPAGATESLLPLATFEELTVDHPVLGGLESDVEALLVRFDRSGKSDCFIAPIDVCYELVGLLRQSWRGFDGGSEAHERIDDFFDRLRRHARPLTMRAGRV